LHRAHFYWREGSKFPADRGQKTTSAQTTEEQSAASPGGPAPQFNCFQGSTCQPAFDKSVTLAFRLGWLRLESDVSKEDWHLFHRYTTGHLPVADPENFLSSQLSQPLLLA